MIETRSVSPFLLLQEIYHPDEWKVMVCCIFLNKTNRAQVDKIREAFFARWPKPESVREDDFDEMSSMLKPLGLYNVRSKTIIRFSKEYVAGNWNDIADLPGIGKYARDSYSIFFENVIVENPADHVLKDYVKWYNQLHVQPESTDTGAHRNLPENNQPIGSFITVWGRDPDQQTNVRRTNGRWGAPSLERMFGRKPRRPRHGFQRP